MLTRLAGAWLPAGRAPGAALALALGFLAQNLTVSFTFGLYGVFVSYFAETFRVGRTLASLGLPLVVLTIGIINPWVGRLIDRYPLRRLMSLGALVMSAGFLGAAAAPVPEAVLSFFVLIGVGAALMGTLPATSLASKWYDRNRGRAIGFVNLPLAAVIMPPLANGMFQSLGWRASFVCLSVVLLLFVPVLQLLQDPPEQAIPGQSGSGAADGVPGGLTPSRLFRSPFFWLAALSAGVILASGSARSVHIVAYATDLGIDGARASILLSVSAAFAIPGALLFGALSDRIGGSAALALNALFQVVGWNLLLYSSADFPLLAGSVALLGLCSGGVYVALSTMFSIRYGSGRLGTALGCASAVKLPLTFLGPLVIAYCFDRLGDYVAAFLGIAVLLAVCAVTFGVLAKRHALGRAGATMSSVRSVPK